MNWTDADKAEAVRMSQTGVTHSEIAKHFGVSRNAISGAVYRHKNPNAHRVYHSKPSIVRSGGVRLRPLYDPSKAPFAADCSCPDFAWDEQHCAAVLAAGGFTSLEDYRRAA